MSEQVIRPEKVLYHLQIHLPDPKYLMVFETSAPFLGFNKGDAVNLISWPAFPGQAMGMVAKSVEHSFVQANEPGAIRHKVVIHLEHPQPAK